jgi:hypothetical protein
MPRLREVLNNTGVPQEDFIVVPKGSQNLVWLDGAKGALGISHDGKVDVETVTKRNLSRIAEGITRHHTSGSALGTMRDYQKQLWTRMVDIVEHHPGHLLAITGKAPGWGKLKVASGGRSYQADIGVSKQSYIDVAFRFVQHKAPNGGFGPDTIHRPDAAEDWVATLNWIYGPQANVHFDLLDAEWVTLDQAPSQPVGRDFFLKSIATAPPVLADVTIYLVGTWGGGASGHSRGTYFDNTGIAVVTDAPAQEEIPEGINVFMLTMAHEILHYLREARHMPGSHHDRERVLLSNGIQTLKIDKQLVLDINPPG